MGLTVLHNSSKIFNENPRKIFPCAFWGPRKEKVLPNRYKMADLLHFDPFRFFLHTHKTTITPINNNGFTILERRKKKKTVVLRSGKKR